MWDNLLAQSTPSPWIDALARTPLSKVLIFVGVCTAVRLIAAPYLAKVPAHQRTGTYNVVKFLNEIMDAIVYAGVFVFLLIRPFFIQTFTIPSESMVDTLLVNDYIVANKGVYRYSDPKNGDIVVFRPPVRAAHADQIDPDSGEVKVDFIKRLIGSPGEVIEVRGGKLYRDNKPVDEPYVSSPHGYDFKLVKYRDEYWPLAIQGQSVNESFVVDKFHLSSTDEKTMEELLNLPAAPIPPGHYLFMGDNRANSSDGRAWGIVPRESVIGRAEFIWFPISRWRRVR